MKTKTLFGVTYIVIVLIIFEHSTPAAAQQSSLEIPLELVGFPVIIAAVRLSNFVKKLAYSLNPRTYTGRARRAISSRPDMIDMLEAEKRLVLELGENVCIYPKVCLHHADKASKSKGRREMVVDWDEIFSHYKTTKEKQKQFYLLSVFLGDFIASPRFCTQLVKRGRSCTD